MQVQEIDEIMDRARRMGATVIHIFHARDGSGARVAFRSDGKMGAPEQINGDRALRLEDDMSARLEDEETRTPHARSGHMRIRGADVAAIRMRDSSDRISWALHIGKNTIEDIDLNIQDRMRINSDLSNRCRDFGESDRLRGELADVFDRVTSLADFDLDEFARTHGVTLRVTETGDLTADRNVMLEVHRRLKASGASYLSVAAHDLQRDVIRERLTAAISFEKDPTTRDALRGRLAEAEAGAAARAAAIKRQEDVDAGVGQEVVDEDEFVARIHALGASLLGGADDDTDRVARVVDVLTMLPLIEIPEIATFAKSISGGTWRALYGAILDKAYNSKDRAFGTPWERAAGMCWEIVRDAYDTVKFDGYPPHALAVVGHLEDLGSQIPLPAPRLSRLEQNGKPHR